MPTSAAKGGAAGLQYVQTWLVDSDGYMLGTAGDGAAQATTTHALLLEFAKTAGFPSAQRVMANFTGGNRWLGMVMFGINELGTMTLTTQDINTTLFAMATAAAVDTTTNSRWRRFSDNQNAPIPVQMGMCVSTIFQSFDDGADGLNLWINFIIPRMQLTPAMPSLSYQAAADVTYTIAPTMASKEPHGLLFSAGNMALHKNKCPMYAIISPKPLAFTTYIGATGGAATTFATAYKPSSGIVTLNAAASEFARAGTLVALTSHSTSTAVATMAVAAPVDSKNSLIYETDFVAAA